MMLEARNSFAKLETHRQPENTSVAAAVFRAINRQRSLASRSGSVGAVLCFTHGTAPGGDGIRSGRMSCGYRHSRRRSRQLPGRLPQQHPAAQRAARSRLISSSPVTASAAVVMTVYAQLVAGKQRSIRGGPRPCCAGRWRAGQAVHCSKPRPAGLRPAGTHRP